MGMQVDLGTWSSYQRPCCSRFRSHYCSPEDSEESSAPTLTAATHVYLKKKENGGVLACVVIEGTSCCAASAARPAVKSKLIQQVQLFFLTTNLDEVEADIMQQVQ